MSPPTCGNCGKSESGDIKLKTCVACKTTRYCSRTCQVTHYPQHKTYCKWRAAELFEEKLFQEHTEREECPICMIPLPPNSDQTALRVCCGKTMCYGCVYAEMKEGITSGKTFYDCEFCRTPLPNVDDEQIDLLKKSMEKNIPNAIFQVACFHQEGNWGFPKDLTKAAELFQKAGKLGCVEAYCSLGYLHIEDVKKARHYFELAALGGNTSARLHLGTFDFKAGNIRNARKHFMIGARAGDENCLKAVKSLFNKGFVTKDEYTETLRAYEKQQEDAKSTMRDAALASFRVSSMVYGDPRAGICFSLLQTSDHLFFLPRR